MRLVLKARGSKGSMCVCVGGGLMEKLRKRKESELEFIKCSELQKQLQNALVCAADTGHGSCRAS